MTTPFVTRADCPPALPSASDVDEPVIAGGWYPDVDPKLVRDVHRFRDQTIVTPARLRAALVAAIIAVGNDLEGWRLEQVAAGYALLADVPSPQVDGRSRLVISYLDAVGLTAKARIVERYRDFDTTGAGDRKVDDLDMSIGELRRDALHAIRDILGRTRTTVELI